MPTYDLRCAECGQAFERFLMRVLRDEDKVCPNCGSARVSVGVGGGFVARPLRSSQGASGCVPRGGFS